MSRLVAVFAVIGAFACTRGESKTMQTWQAIDGRLCGAGAPCPPSWRCVTEFSSEDRDAGVELSYCVMPCDDASTCGAEPSQFECLYLAPAGTKVCTHVSGVRFETTD